ncbi:hypothetical protein [Dyella mobilis]|uniref:Uncharacterized protein n=1 Tax=Dyella mobilis TaxID=1849582 RepID=A0ABS2KK10_9GAMM|nr:hypothetical protein [Dyella mobilis]MBM7131499.1 hypothetical protein [Dyella mobilis]GLQ96529.1 hypothetical protein GCM10007863_09470 [Dyella mobilis]
MHYLTIQVQPGLLGAFSESAIDALQAPDVPEGSVLGVEVNRGDDDGPYVNVTFATPNPQVLWPAIREVVVLHGLQRASIITCTGSRGWDNYLLLHHFGREAPTERFGAR